MVGKFIALVTALVTALVGLLFLIAGRYAYMNPDRMLELGIEPGVWVKAVVAGLSVMAIGMVAMAGARRLN
jgi:hypothetical protein